jgi:uncharacterized protein (TIGR03435 family)
VLNDVSPGPLRNPHAPSLFDAIRDQLGLKLELREARDIEALVIDHAQEPPAN